MLILQSRMHSWGCDEILSGWKVPLGHSPWIAPPPCLALPMTMWGSHQYALTKECAFRMTMIAMNVAFIQAKDTSDSFAHILPVKCNLEFQNRAKIFSEAKWCYSKLLYNSRVMQEGEEDGWWNWRQMVSIASQGQNIFAHWRESEIKWLVLPRSKH